MNFYRLNRNPLPLQFATDDEALQYASDSVDSGPLPACDKLIDSRWHTWDVDSQSWIRCHDVTLWGWEVELLKSALDDYYHKQSYKANCTTGLRQQGHHLAASRTLHVLETLNQSLK